MNYLRQSTNSQVIGLGQFLDSTDGNTEEDGLTIANTDIKIRKSNAITLANKNSGGATNISNGVYYTTLDATDTDTVGLLEIYIHVAGALAVKASFEVLNAFSYDAMVIDGVASKAQVDNISITGGGAVNYNPEADNVASPIKGVSFVGVQTSGTYTDTFTLNGIYHQIDDTANEIDIIYSLDITTVNIASEVVFSGYLKSGNDVMNIQAYDFSGVQWETIETINGQGGSSNMEVSAPLLTRHTGNGADAGKVLIRIQNAGQTNPTLFVDRLIVQAISNQTALGFVGGAVWVDTINGTSGTSVGVGFIDNPVDNIADAKIIADANNLRAFDILTGSSFTLAQTFNNYTFRGDGYSIALGGQDIGGCRINNSNVTGIGTGTSRPVFRNTRISSISLSTTLPSFTAVNCLIDGVINLTDQILIPYGFSRSTMRRTAEINYGTAGNNRVDLNDCYGSIAISNLGNTGTDELFMYGNFDIVFNASCTGGTANLVGVASKVNNGTGITINEVARVDNDTINVECDTALTDYDAPTNTEFNARSIPSADYFVVSDYTAPDNASITSILADTNELQLNQGNWLTATGFSTLVATDIVTGGAITTSSGNANVNAVKINGVNVIGTGITSDLWRA